MLKIILQLLLIILIFSCQKQQVPSVVTIKVPEIANDVWMTMSEIVEGARRVSALISDITTAANEQRDGITQVNVAVTQLDQMTQQNAALVEESAAAAASLREQAGRLEQVISVFDVGSSARHLGQKLLNRPSLSHQTSLA